MINFIIENWYLIVAALAILTCATFAGYQFFKKSTDEQIKKVREWLLWAVIKAEEELGSGTGPVKLRYVYAMFIAQFPALSKIVSFELFSKLVDEALEKMKDFLNGEGK